MALVIVVVGSAFIAVAWNITFRQAWFGLEERAGFVDHTTVLNHIQEARARIAQRNITEGNIIRAPLLQIAWTEDPPRAPDAPAFIVNLDQLIINRPANNLVGVDPQRNVEDGMGRGRVDITVFDVNFWPSWIDLNAVDLARMPPSFARHIAGGSLDEIWIPEDEEEPEPPATQANLGAYLIRVELIDSRGEVVRRAEEVFLQDVPPLPVP